MKKKSLVVVIKIAVATTLLSYLIASGKLDLSKLSTIESWGWIAMAQGAVFTMLSLTFLRWHLLLRTQGIRYSLRETYALGFIGFFFSQFVPGSTGGDLVKAYYVAVEHPENRLPGVLSVFLDRILGLVVLVGICGFASVFAYRRIQSDTELEVLSYGILVSLGAIFIGCLLFFNERVRSSPLVLRVLRRVPFPVPLHRVQDLIYAYKGQPGIVFITLSISVGVHMLLVVASICYARALGPESLPTTLFFVLVPLANLAMALPISPGGLGVGELAFVELFRRAGSDIGDFLAVLHRLSFYTWALIGLIVYLLKKKQVKRAMALGESLAEAEAEARRA